ncbi:protein misato [Prorops nasuta]|uniref:protein misato n=1 Tax=Prorops nasuta TaxID=863751 RepID=UPI0034CE0713
MTREIVTIQLGHYSNFIGTHWWNIQETNFSYDPANPSEINHDVLYREGETQKREVTYTPRLLVVDLKGSNGYLNEQGTLYDTSNSGSNEPILWDDENLEVSTESAIAKPKFIEDLDRPSKDLEEHFYDLENSIKTWADYLIPRYHPRTLSFIKKYKHECSEQPFDVFTYGRALWNEPQFADDFSDKIRKYVEECDFLQGFQILLDSTDAFGGLGSSCIQHLHDEYGKSIICFPSINYESTEPSMKSLVKAINTALSWQCISENSSLFSPLCVGENSLFKCGSPRKFQYLNYNPELKYHSSALLATALDTLTLRYRRKEYSNIVLSDLCADLNKLGRKAAATSLTLPFPMIEKRDLIDILDDFADSDSALWTSLTPFCDISCERSMQCISLRGVPEDRLKRPLSEAKKQISKPAYKCSSVHEMMTLFLACTCRTTATYLSTIESGLKIKTPYPNIFNTNVTENGNIAGWPVGIDVKSVPVMAGIHSGSSLGLMYESLHEQLRKVKNIKKYHTFLDSGLEEDEFKECLEHLLDSKELYEDHYD